MDQDSHPAASTSIMTPTVIVKSKNPLNALMSWHRERAYPLLLISVELHSSDNRAPLPELIDPVMKRGFWNNDHVGPFDTAVLMQVTQQGYGLKSLSQTLHQQPLHPLF